jgi:hypothetical protein
MAYDTNVIVQFLNGNGDDIITRGTNSLKNKLHLADDHVVTINWCGYRPFGMPPVERQALATGLGYLTAQSRLYLRGHGDWEHRTLGGWTAREVAGALVQNGLALSPQMISVTGCQCARALPPGNEGKEFVGFQQQMAASQLLLEQSTHSFAGILHSRLRPLGVTSPVFGRVFSITVIGDNDEHLMEGQKITALPNGNEKSHRRRSKILFTWNGGTQVQEWVQYI